MSRIKGVRYTKGKYSKGLGQMLKHPYAQTYGKTPSGTGAHKVSSLVMEPLDKEAAVLTPPGGFGGGEHASPLNLYLGGLKNLQLLVAGLGGASRGLVATDGSLKGGVQGAVGSAGGVALGRTIGEKIDKLTGASFPYGQLVGTMIGMPMGYALVGPNNNEHKKEHDSDKKAELKHSSLFLKQAPAHSKAQARLMAMKSKEEGHPEKIKEWMSGYKTLPEHKKEKNALTLIELGLGTTLAGLMAHSIYNKVKKPEEVKPIVEKKKEALDHYTTALKYAPIIGGTLGAGLGYLQAPEGSGLRGATLGAIGGTAGGYAGQQLGNTLGTGYMLGSSAANRVLHPAQNEAARAAFEAARSATADKLELGLAGLGSLFGYTVAKPTYAASSPQAPSTESENEGYKEAAEDSIPSDRLEYETIVHMIADAYKIDLTSPEGLEQLPTIMREADRILQKHEHLETAEDEMAEQMAGQEKKEKMQNV